ncbi:MAG TPA: hypothetical protein PKW28_10835, partial [Turneriella sp.]|nr:hypothetical protein [Turneriella sp.]
MKLTRTHSRAIRIITIAALLLLAVSAGVLLREYLMLKKIQATLRQSPSQIKNEPEQNTPAEAVPE